MASISSVPSIQFTPAGVVIPTEAEVLAGVQADIDQAFGGGLNPALETPQGQLASSQAAVIADKNAEIATITNQVDPQYADGRFQDAIARIYFLTRKGATSTSVLATVTGPVGGIVTAGTLMQDTSGNTYAATGDITIGSAGNATGEFQNVKTGPIPCPAGTLTKIYQAGAADSITNATDGTLGRDVETRADFEYRRQNSVEIHANGTPGAIYAEVFGISDVLDCYVIDNPTGAAVLKGSTNYSVAAHSVYVAVVGGTDAEVAAAIWRKKDLGCDMNGDTTVNVTDESGYSHPQPGYIIKFERPAALPVLFDIQIANSALLPSDIISITKAAIIARFNGTDGTTRERIGATILASRYYGAIASVAPTASVISILIGTVTATLNQLLVGIDQRPTISVADISVTLV